MAYIERNVLTNFPYHGVFFKKEIDESLPKLMLRLLRSPHTDSVTKAMANHDSLVIATLRNKVDTLLQKCTK